MPLGARAETHTKGRRGTYLQSLNRHKRGLVCHNAMQNVHNPASWRLSRVKILMSSDERSSFITLFPHDHRKIFLLFKGRC
jgi:hypothetical protein